MPSLDDTRALALRLMDELGLDLLGEPLAARGWTFGFDRARRRLGVCRIGEKRITLSAHLSQTLAASDVEDTIRHEIAHAVDVERRGRSAHDATWKALARVCGAAPERTFRGDLPDDVDAAAYRAVCPSCGAASGLHRQPVHPRRCRACHEAGEPAYLTVTHAESGRVVWPGGATPGAFGGWVGVEATCPGCGATVRRARRPLRRTLPASLPAASLRLAEVEALHVLGRGAQEGRAGGRSGSAAGANQKRPARMRVRAGRQVVEMPGVEPGSERRYSPGVYARSQRFGVFARPAGPADGLPGGRRLISSRPFGSAGASGTSSL